MKEKTTLTKAEIKGFQMMRKAMRDVTPFEEDGPKRHKYKIPVVMLNKNR